MDYKYFGLLSVSILIVGLWFVVYRWPLDRHSTFSQHVAPHRVAILYYIALFALVLPLFAIFFIRWFTPHFGFTKWLNVFVIISVVFQFACTLIPEIGGRMTTWHKSLVGISAGMLVPVLALLLFQSAVSNVSKMLVATTLGIMLYCIYATAKAKTAPRNFLFIQCAYFAAFFMPTMYISYLQ